jgi:hypothetical protein
MLAIRKDTESCQRIIQRLEMTISNKDQEERLICRHLHSIGCFVIMYSGLDSTLSQTQLLFQKLLKCLTLMGLFKYKMVGSSSRGVQTLKKKLSTSENGCNRSC